MGRALDSLFIYSCIHLFNRYYFRYWANWSGSSRGNQLDSSPHREHGSQCCDRHLPRDCQHKDESHPNLEAKSGKTELLTSAKLCSLGAEHAQLLTAQIDSTLTWEPCCCHPMAPGGQPRKSPIQVHTKSIFHISSTHPALLVMGPLYFKFCNTLLYH